MYVRVVWITNLLDKMEMFFFLVHIEIKIVKTRIKKIVNKIVISRNQYPATSFYLFKHINFLRMQIKMCYNKEPTKVQFETLLLVFIEKT